MTASDVSMDMRHRWLARSAVTTAIFLQLSSAGFGQARSAPAPLALVGGTIYVSPTDAPIEDAIVLLSEGKIDAVGRRGSVQIPRGTETLDCSGLTITAGFWNSHVHFTERQWAGAGSIPADELTGQLQAMLTRHGVTSAFDTGSSWENTRRLRDRIESGEVQGPRIRSTGELLMPKGGSPTQEMLNLIGAMRIQTPEITEVSDAVAAAKKLLDAGTDGIKLYAATWYPPFVTLPENAIAAASDEAHRRGKLVFVHPTNGAGLLAALKGGADILVHTTPESGAWDETVLSAMKQRGVALIPTLKLWKYELRHDRASARERFVSAAIGQLRAWNGSGGVVLFGTDVGYMNDYDPSDEYALMAEAGMDFRQILASLTTAPAGRFGASKELGRIAKGLTADLVVLSRDPATDVRQLAAVRYTIRDGAIIYQQP
jgi:imidazolonepropionase-like amidohydrolase